MKAPLPADVARELRRAWPYALVLALGLGGIVAVGANLSNAFPSEKAPFGWPGPATFENGVAMVRSDVVLAASLPALVLGALALGGRDPRATPASGLWRIAAPHACLLVLGAFVAGGIGALFAAETPLQAYLAFGVAHALLALAFYALAFVWGAFLRRAALAGALATWMFFLGVYEGLVRVSLFRQVGYHELAAGNFPTWFFVAQALSPLSAYRGVLILWREHFMDFMEQAALGQASLPGWANPGTFAVAMLALWVALPLGIASLAWWWRGRADVSARARRAPDETA